jgi:hypothetical protein
VVARDIVMTRVTKLIMAAMPQLFLYGYGNSRLQGEDVLGKQIGESAGTDLTCPFV